VLVVRRGVALESLLAGHQEAGRRGGTPSLPFIEALSLALERSLASLPERMRAVGQLRDLLERSLCEAIPGARVNGSGERVANTTNVMFKGLDGEALLIALDLAGISASSGAACASGSLKPSHVLTSMGRTEAEARASLRFSLGDELQVAQVGEVVRTVTRQVQAQAG
jgi:cysteine desulfurase